MSGSTDVSLYNNNNNNNNNNINSSEAVLKVERSADTPTVDESGTRNYFLRWKGFEGNLIRSV
jgi:hypothetical protein